jgi:hypothetical protein
MTRLIVFILVFLSGCLGRSEKSKVHVPSNVSLIDTRICDEYSFDKDDPNRNIYETVDLLHALPLECCKKFSLPMLYRLERSDLLSALQDPCIGSIDAQFDSIQQYLDLFQRPLSSQTGSHSYGGIISNGMHYIKDAIQSIEADIRGRFKISETETRILPFRFLKKFDLKAILSLSIEPNGHYRRQLTEFFIRRNVSICDVLDLSMIGSTLDLDLFFHGVVNYTISRNTDTEYAIRSACYQQITLNTAKRNRWSLVHSSYYNNTRGILEKVPYRPFFGNSTPQIILDEISAQYFPLLPVATRVELILHPRYMRSLDKQSLLESMTRQDLLDLIESIHTENVSDFFVWLEHAISMNIRLGSLSDKKDGLRPTSKEFSPLLVNLSRNMDSGHKHTIDMFIEKCLYHPVTKDSHNTTKSNGSMPSHVSTLSHNLASPMHIPYWIYYFPLLGSLFI